MNEKKYNEKGTCLGRAYAQETFNFVIDRSFDLVYVQEHQHGLCWDCSTL